MKTRYPHECAVSVLYKGNISNYRSTVPMLCSYSFYIIVNSNIIDFKGMKKLFCAFDILYIYYLISQANYEYLICLNLKVLNNYNTN